MDRYENLTENELLEKIWENIVKKWARWEIFKYKWVIIEYRWKLEGVAVDIEIYMNWKQVFWGCRNILDIIAKPIAEIIKDWISNSLKD